MAAPRRIFGQSSNYLNGNHRNHPDTTSATALAVQAGRPSRNHPDTTSDAALAAQPEPPLLFSNQRVHQFATAADQLFQRSSNSLGDNHSNRNHVGTPNSSGPTAQAESILPLSNQRDYRFATTTDQLFGRSSSYLDHNHPNRNHLDITSNSTPEAQKQPAPLSPDQRDRRFNATTDQSAAITKSQVESPAIQAKPAPLLTNRQDHRFTTSTKKVAATTDSVKGITPRVSRCHLSATNDVATAVQAESSLLPSDQREHQFTTFTDPVWIFAAGVDSSRSQVEPRRHTTFAEHLSCIDEGRPGISQFLFRLQCPSGELYLRRTRKWLDCNQGPTGLFSSGIGAGISINTSNTSVNAQQSPAATEALVSACEPLFGLSDPSGFSNEHYVCLIQIIAKRRAESLLEQLQIRYLGVSRPLEEDSSSQAWSSYLSNRSEESNYRSLRRPDSRQSDLDPSSAPGPPKEARHSPVLQPKEADIFHRLNATEMSEEHVSAYQDMLTYRNTKDQVPGTSRMLSTSKQYEDIRNNLFILAMYLNDTPANARNDSCFASHLSKAILAMVDSIMPQISGRGLQGLNDLDILSRAFILPAEPWVVWAYTIQELCKTVVKLLSRQPEKVLVLARHPLVRKFTLHEEWKNNPAYSKWLSPSSANPSCDADAGTLIGYYKTALHGAIGLLSCYVTHLFGKDDNNCYLIHGVSDDDSCPDFKDLKFGDARVTVTNSPGIFVYEAGIKVLETCKALQEASYLKHSDDLVDVVIESILRGMTRFAGNKVWEDLGHINQRIQTPTTILRPTANTFLPQQPTSSTQTRRHHSSLYAPAKAQKTGTRHRSNLSANIPQSSVSLNSGPEAASPISGTPRGTTRYPYDIYGPPVAAASSQRSAVVAAGHQVPQPAVLQNGHAFRQGQWVPQNAQGQNPPMFKNSPWAQPVIGYYTSPLSQLGLRSNFSYRPVPQQNGPPLSFEGTGTYIPNFDQNGRFLAPAIIQRPINPTEPFFNLAAPMPPLDLAISASLPPKPPAPAPIVPTPTTSGLPPRPPVPDLFLDQGFAASSPATRVSRRPATYVISHKGISIGSPIEKLHQPVAGGGSTHGLVTGADYFGTHHAATTSSSPFRGTPAHNGGRVAGATRLNTSPAGSQQQQASRQENILGLSNYMDPGSLNSSTLGRHQRMLFRPTPRDARTSSRPLSMHVDEYEAIYGNQFQNPQ